MKIAHSMQGIYSPLPQSQSDSDSEKEITMEPICTSYNSKNSNNFEASYRPNGKSIHLDDDIVKIKRGASKMSTARKVAFVSSIILCFLPIIIFLWVLPCSELHTCPVKITNWEYQQEDIELKGPINLVNGLYKTNYNLALLYKGSFNSPNTLKNGVISFMGLTGTVAWEFRQEVEPFAIDCKTIDTDNDGTLDCLLVDHKGLKAIETISGQALWHAHSEEKSLLMNLELPVAISDLDNDGIVDLLSVFNQDSFLVISGKTGRVLAKIRVPYCERIKGISSADKQSETVLYRCTNSSGNEALYEVTFEEIRKNYANPQNIIEVKEIKEIIPENIYMAGNRKLVVKNGPTCPKCHCEMTLYDDKDQVLKTWPYNNAFIMNPKPFAFESSKVKNLQLQGHLNGFIVKIWQWTERVSKIRPTQRVNRRSVPFSHSNETWFTTEVSEGVVMITFNDTDVHVINASFTEINQICRKDLKDLPNCQPSVDNQKDSLLVQDLDHDSSKELISFYSSYVKKEDDWHLISYMKVLRLEEELPKLYGTK